MRSPRTSSRTDSIISTWSTATGKFLGVVSLHDIKPYLNEPEMADVIIAEDILREDFPTVTPNVPLGRALDTFRPS